MKKDVAADLPDKMIADLPVQLDDEYGRGIREAERELGERMAANIQRKGGPLHLLLLAGGQWERGDVIASSF